VGVVVVGDNATAVDGGDGEEEDAAIVMAEGNNAMTGPPSLSPSPLISIPLTMSALLYSPMPPLFRHFKLGMGGGIDEMTPKEGESNRACPAISFLRGGGFSLVVVS
jgi:hypothetical protein